MKKKREERSGLPAISHRVRLPIIVGRVRSGRSVEDVLERLPVKRKHRLVLERALRALLKPGRSAQAVIMEHLREIPKEEQSEFIEKLNQASRQLYSKYDLDTERTISVPERISDPEFRKMVLDKLGRLKTLVKQQSGDLKYYIEHIDFRTDDAKLVELIDVLKDISKLSLEEPKREHVEVPKAQRYRDIVEKMAKLRLNNEYVGLLYNKYKAARTVLQEIIEEGEKRGYTISFSDLVDDLKEELSRLGLHPELLKYFHFMKG